MEELFKIYKVDTQEAIRIRQSENLPHQHHFEELVIGIKGGLVHFIDFKTEIYNAPFISFVTKGKIHRVEPILIDNDVEFWVIRFKSELIPDTTFQLYKYYHDQANFSLDLHANIHRINTICELILEEYQHPNKELAIIKDLLIVLFSMIEVERRRLQQPGAISQHNQNTIFRNFLAILEENFRRNEGVQFYAEKLFMTPKSLNAITQQILHQTVTELIETRKMIEAKNLLFSTNSSISEIAFELGYQDKSYFTAVFKKKSGQTPTEFREEMKRIFS